MINLLSPHDKRELRAARRNIILRRYTVLVAMTLIAVAFVFGGGIFIAMRDRMAAERELEVDRQQATEYQETRQAAEQFEANLNIARRILSDEISYSTLVIDIAKTLPSDAVLTDLTLNPSIFGSPTTLSARTTSYETALTLRDSLEASPLFSDVSLISATRDDDAGNPDSEIGQRLPVNVQLNATIANPNTVEGATE